MKKKLSLLLVMTVVCSIMLMGCGSSAASVEGTTWLATSATNPEGEEFSEEDFAGVFGEITYEFQEGGILVASAAGQDVEGTWSQNKNEVTVDAGGATVTATIKGDTMTMLNQGAKIIFQKQ